MAHFLSMTPNSRPNDGKILLSSFSHVALQMEAQRRLLRSERGRSRRGKKGPKKQPQRGLGVAQLEKIRLEEQRQAAREAQLVALRVHGGSMFSHQPISPFEQGNRGTLACNPFARGSDPVISPARQRLEDARSSVSESLPASISWNGYSWQEICSRERHELGFKPLVTNGNDHSFYAGEGKGYPLHNRRTECVEDHCKLPIFCKNQSDLARIGSMQLQNSMFHRQSSVHHAPLLRVFPPSLERAMKLSSFQINDRDAAEAKTAEVSRMKRRACGIVTRKPPMDGIVWPRLLKAMSDGVKQSQEQAGDKASDNRSDTVTDYELSLRPPGIPTTVTTESDDVLIPLYDPEILPSFPKHDRPFSLPVRRQASDFLSLAITDGIYDKLPEPITDCMNSTEQVPSAPITNFLDVASCGLETGASVMPANSYSDDVSMDLTLKL